MCCGQKQNLEGLVRRGMTKSCNYGYDVSAARELSLLLEGKMAVDGRTTPISEPTFRRITKLLPTELITIAASFCAVCKTLANNVSAA